MINLPQKAGRPRPASASAHAHGSAPVRAARRSLAASCLFAVFALAPAVAQQSGGGTPVQPEPKPQMLIAKPERNPLLPRPRPDPQDAAAAEVAEPAGDAGKSLTTGAVNTADSGEPEACLWRLRALGVEIEPQPPIDEAGGCRIAAPLVISEFSPKISVYPDATLVCGAVEALTGWMNEVVVPAAREHLDAEPIVLLQSSAYDCADPKSAARPGEHASGSAIDITGIVFRQRKTVAIRSRDTESGPERAFQRAIRSGACRFFANVVGPGAEAGFDGKLHLGADARPGGSKACR